jgi:hypothetical protein
MVAVWTAEILGIEVPDAGPVFLAALAVHVPAGVTAVVAGALAASAGKRAGRHPRAGTVYLYAVSVLFATATVMAALRWHEDWYLFALGAVAFGLAGFGYRARRRRPRGWRAWHGAAMAGSYIAMLTAFYVDNGPQLPVWNRLPWWAFWLLPAAIGIPLTGWALVRNGAIRERCRSTRQAPRRA